MSNVTHRVDELEWPALGSNHDCRIARGHQKQDGENGDDRSGLNKHAQFVEHGHSKSDIPQQQCPDRRDVPVDVLRISTCCLRRNDLPNSRPVTFLSRHEPGRRRDRPGALDVLHGGSDLA